MVHLVLVGTYRKNIFELSSYEGVNPVYNGKGYAGCCNIEYLLLFDIFVPLGKFTKIMLKRDALG